jgi:ribosomal protein S10
MSSFAKAKDVASEESRVHRIRITLTSRNVKNLEKVCADLKRGAVDKKLKVNKLFNFSKKLHSISTQAVDFRAHGGLLYRHCANCVYTRAIY